MDYVDFILHIDRYLPAIIQDYGIYSYLLLFVVIFCETGLIVAPFLPGDSLLFAAGAFSATGALDVKILFIILSVAAIIGDSVNYWIGTLVGPEIFHKRKLPLINKEHLRKTEEFYEKHGGKTIILARFMPVIRTFAPFVAGIGKMSYSRFLEYNIIGGLLWNGLFIFGGYFFGNLPIVKDNFSLAILAIIVISFMPGIIEYVRHLHNKRKHAAHHHAHNK
ncbi:MAG: DedA family protein [Candidatus Altiarchaeota archaeon]|nr:DedA family protein [Candidatus Altiarchaeota archaeon]